MNTLRITVISTLISLVIFVATACTDAQKMEKETSEINANAGVLTMINVLTPAPGKQQETIRLLQAGMNETMRYQPGFISANIHKSLNSEHVVVYAQWKDQASVDEAVKLIQSGKAPNMEKAFTIAHADYHPYEVVSVHRASKQE